jgi:cyanophycinase
MIASIHVRFLVALFLYTSLSTAPAAAQEVISSIVSNAIFLAEADANHPLPTPDTDENEVPGALLLCGGGQLPDSILEKFHSCGRGENGRLVIIPSASESADTGDFTPSLNLWRAFTWGNVDVLHAFDRAQADAEEFAEKLQSATAVWIGGGDQKRLSQLYCGTTVEREIQNVMCRGGVVGGTSAGSAIASRVMIAGGTSRPQLAEGLDLLPNSIVDQHFSQRSRFQRLASAVAENPDRVGIGIDESTGLLIKNKQAEVVGLGAVYVYSKKERTQPVVRTVSTELPIRTYSANAAELQLASNPNTSDDTKQGDAQYSEIEQVKFASGVTLQSNRALLKKTRPQ